MPHGVRHNLAGRSFGRWTVLSEGPKRSNHLLWNCRCSCGNERPVLGSQLIRGRSNSCGCDTSAQVIANTTHGKSRTATYRTWISIKRRCFSPSAKGYSDYGGRGITMCTRWVDSFDNFLSDMGEKPSGSSIDRINVDGPYEPSNCRWATSREQSENKRTNVWITHDGRTLTVSQWARDSGLPYGVLYDRLRSRYSLAEAIRMGTRVQKVRKAPKSTRETMEKSR